MKKGRKLKTEINEKKLGRFLLIFYLLLNAKIAKFCVPENFIMGDTRIYKPRRLINYVTNFAKTLPTQPDCVKFCRLLYPLQTRVTK